MTTIEEEVQSLLRATDDVAGWHRAVRALDASAATSVIIEFLKDENEPPPKRRLAAEMLGILGDRRAVPALVAAMQAADRVLRGRAAETLGRFANLDPAIVQQLLQGLADPDPYFRECCAKALGQLKRIEALPALQQMRDHDPLSSNREVAQEAIKAIQGAH